MKNVPQVVSFRCTLRCNNNCKYCFSSKNTNIKEMNLSRLNELFILLDKMGVKAILLTGGEPLIREDIDQIILELKNFGFKVFVDTNGDLFFKHKDILSKHVDIIGLPIDFPDSSYRNKDNLKTVLKILDYFKNIKKHPKIRIGTVVIKDNYKKLGKIGDLLKNYPVNTWKLYQFTPQGIFAIKSRTSLEISKDQFNKFTQKIKNRYSHFFKIIISEREERNRAYFFINPDGTVSIPIDNLDICRQKKIGTIFDKDILDKWRKLVSFENYEQNVKTTFFITCFT